MELKKVDKGIYAIHDREGRAGVIYADTIEIGEQSLCDRPVSFYRDGKLIGQFNISEITGMEDIICQHVRIVEDK